MGGDTISVSGSSIDDEDLSTIKQVPDRFTEIPSSWQGGLCVKPAEENEPVFRESDARSFRNSYKTEIDANKGRMRNVYAQVFKNYEELQHRIVNMEAAKSKILSYTPGSWVENVGGKTMSDYDVPKTTTLLLIGPKGSGKTSLVNRISRVFEDDKFAPERAQVTYNSHTGDGTFFLQEYMIPRSSTSFCMYDTRSFSDDLYENLEMIKRWMTRGVCHGALVKSGSDGSSLLAKMKRKSCQDKVLSYERRTVNFVIFVVNGLSVLKCVDSDEADTQYAQMVAEIFSSPYLSFKDHKPVIAITHGDLLSLSERARIRVYLGELLGVHPSKQTFDIPDNSEPITELATVDMIRYALEHADRNLPCKTRPMISKGSIIWPWTCLILLLAIGNFIFAAHLHVFRSPKVHTESIPEPNLDINEIFRESIPKPSPEIKEVFTDGIPKPSLELKKVRTEWIPESKLDKSEIFAESIPKPNPEIKEVFSDSIPKPNLEMKKVPTKRIPEPNLGINEVFTESIPKPSPEMKEVFVDGIPKPSLKLKKVHTKRIAEPNLEIDWKKIRHLWYR